MTLHKLLPQPGCGPVGRNRHEAQTHKKGLSATCLMGIVTGPGKKWWIPADLRVKVDGNEKNFSRRPVLKYELVIYLEDKIRKGFLLCFLF